jgi:hypothetical protein
VAVPPELGRRKGEREAPSASGGPGDHGATRDDIKAVAGLIPEWLARERISRDQFVFKMKLG